MKEQPPDGLRRPGKRPRLNRAGARVFQQDPGDQGATNQHAGNPKQKGHPAAAGALLFSGIQKHDDEDEENHHRSRVDDHLDGGHEFRSQQQIFRRKGSHHDDQR